MTNDYIALTDAQRATARKLAELGDDFYSEWYDFKIVSPKQFAVFERDRWKADALLVDGQIVRNRRERLSVAANAASRTAIPSRRASSDNGPTATSTSP